ncbi:MULTISPECIES: 6-carboxytetrahydropterin synthase QueD [Thermoanaerobacterium]|uniref:6-carboxy-5,6,7,8-tetrahydropterin synthase n=2 Tax=Thermoanaerobacterium TaxID=28895 RepID=W9EG28_9THEO|nr:MULTISPECIES: 6-carboxytetrahydropterin synthase QueD [Thermoanaerobacterium]AFK85976.1 queuosine biosynthesis protein QueD [Thermoanaerobacterium saccharolyticum JW/SL-YS485]ETO38684.1 queuosine biosynthesis protein QueD [Thermoanaerobacterium aotearoense SCUT27]
MKVTKSFTFDSAHNLTKYNGKCENLHGHTYKLEVTVEGGIDDEGMVIDFAQLKAIVDSEVVKKLDHAYLNDVLGFNTTCENIAMWMWEKLDPLLKSDRFHLFSIRLWETPTSFAEVTIQDFTK